MPHALKFSAVDARVVEDEIQYQGYFRLHRRVFQHRRFDGQWSELITREVFERGDAVGVLPYDPVSDSLILVEQFRPGAVRGEDSPWMLELIAGVVEEGESDEDLVHREAREEAACELSELVEIATFFPSAGACTEQVRLFCGRVTQAGVGEIHGLDSENEDILVHRVPRLEAMALLAANQVPNGHTLIALQWLHIHCESLRERWA